MPDPHDHNPPGQAFGNLGIPRVSTFDGVAFERAIAGSFTADSQACSEFMRAIG